jgi:hypothetical protein
MKHSLLLALGLLAATASSASAGTVSIRATGVVAGNSLSISPLAGQPFNAPVVLTFDVTTPGSPWPSAPADGFEYVIDPTTFTVDVNGAQLGMVSASEVLVLIDGFPVADRLHIDVAGLDSGLSMACQVGFTGATFSSLDITEQFGLYDFATLTSYDWRISGSGVGAMFIDFSDVEILPGSFGTPFCFGDGSGLACPCGNTGAAGEGCANSALSGGLLSGVGTNSVSADDAQFSVVGLPAGKTALLFGGNADLGTGSPFGDGIRCAGGNLERLGLLTTDAGGSATWPIGLAAQQGWSAGDRRFFQVWYRDPAGPCSSLFNASSGLDVTFGV